MIPVKQKIGAGPPDGDCLRACIASILELPIEDLPNPVSNRWQQEWADYLGPLGYSYVCIDLENPGFSWWGIELAQYWIATVPSLNYEGFWHSIVMQGTMVVHDPSTAKNYERYSEIGDPDVPVDVRDMTFLIPTNPVQADRLIGGE